MAAYQLIANATSVVRESDGAIIPADPANRDYQAYEAWLVAGNTADSAPVPAKPSIIPIQAFWARFTAAEQAAIQTAAAATPAIAHGMTFALAAGQVNLLAGGVNTTWMPLVVAAGAVTAARSAIILTP